MPTNALVALDVADHIGDGSAHAEQMPGYAVSILDEIAEAQRRSPRTAGDAHILVGLTIAYRAVLQCRFILQSARLTTGRDLIDTWTGDSLAHFVRLADDDSGDILADANNRNADVFAARLARDIVEGGL